MRRCLVLFLFIVLLSSENFAQSPFNYGQNKDVYFISTALRERLGIRVVYKVEQLEKNREVSLLILKFKKDTISDEWFPFASTGQFVYDWDSIAKSSRYWNGSSYEPSANGLLKSYGGYGSGALDWHEITRYAEGISLNQITCNDRCGGIRLKYTKNIFNKDGYILRSINYPIIEDSLAGRFMGHPLSVSEFNNKIGMILKTGSRPDTILFRYNDAGRLIQIKTRFESINPGSNLEQFFSYGKQFDPEYFYQYYIGKLKFEDFIKRKVGFLPKLILMEIYKHGVFSFLLTPKDQRYRAGKTIILEKYED